MRAPHFHDPPTYSSLRPRHQWVVRRACSMAGLDDGVVRQKCCLRVVTGMTRRIGPSACSSLLRPAHSQQLASTSPMGGATCVQKSGPGGWGCTTEVSPARGHWHDLAHSPECVLLTSTTRPLTAACIHVAKGCCDVRAAWRVWRMGLYDRSVACAWSLA